MSQVLRSLHRAGRVAAPDDEKGFTLVELLVASTMSLILVAAACAMLISAVRDQPKITERADQVGQARTVSERMVTELRQGVELITKEPSKVVFLTYVHASTCTEASGGSTKEECRVTYNCTTSGTCTRSVLNADGTGTARTTTLVTGLSNPTEVFSYLPSTEEPTYVGIELQFPDAEKKTTTTLENGATLRNATLGY
ncbi:MAG TPA: prepilin-type N-terminal cleavage/methylation domain-containing protein [Solirubrobacterales bacterium]|nr:prepilin-type N-terminal cleavage/methylation domain-containing protein [Solirubrobacterales bacterium]